ncbi:MAG: hypothetical protein GF418_10130 [Chitinivibrionales bacterium]|nr:hypothetical protein [Chitinivibrionales bacterium]MBD3395970.1 hypothetical protein [Chitinivibrionales bacterium]
MSTVDLPENPTHFLRVTKQPNSNQFAQEIRDVFGNVVKTWSEVDPLSSEEEIVANYYHDILGNVLREEAPRNGDNHEILSATTYEYNTLGQVVEKTSPDGGTTRYKYDSGGRLRYVEPAALRDIYGPGSMDGYLVYNYDKLGRLRFIGVAKGLTGDYAFDNLTGDEAINWVETFPNGFSHRIAKVYDDLTVEDFSIYKLDMANPATIVNSLANTRGRLVADIAYPESNLQTRVADIYGYDDEGRIDVKYKKIPGVPLQTFEYEYDLQGRMVEQRWKNGYQAPQVRTYSYDDDGRLERVGGDGDDPATNQPLVKYGYLPTGLLAWRQFHDNEAQAAAAGNVDYGYNIRDWLEVVESAPTQSSVRGKFYEEMTYDVAGQFDAQYNGNISMARYEYYRDAGDIARVFYHYNYDKANRLNAVRLESGGEFTGFPDPPYPSSSDLEEAMSYDPAGRFYQKAKGSRVPAEGYHYQYYRDETDPDNTRLTSRLQNLTNDNAEDYAYDYNGNMVLDREKKMVVEYDWRDMPIRFSFYSDDVIDGLTAIGEDGSFVGPISEHVVAQIDYLITGQGFTMDQLLLSEVEMIYDASGNRVAKIEN